jgi:hypothetical protein
VVARDASGNFSAGTITAALSGNALTATTATNQSGGTVNATTGAFSGLLTVQQNSTTAVQIASGFTIGMGDWGLRNTTPYGYIQFGPANTSYAHIYTDRPNFYFDKDILVNGNLVLTSANYNSYAPTLTGTGASGTWGINITGSAGSAGSASSVPWTGVSAGTRTNYDLGFQPSGSGYSGFYFSKSTSSAGAADAGYFLIKGVADNFGPYTAEGITLVSDANSLNLFARGSALVAGGNAWVRMGTGTSETFRLMSDYSYSLNSSRAPIFYDSDDTAYYVTPNGTSNIYNLTIKGVMGNGTAPLQLSPVSSSGTFQWASTSISASLGSGQTMAHFIGNALSAGNSGYVGFNYTGAASGSNYVALGHYANDHILRVYYATYTESSGSMRAPIFYDSDNTGYYVDPSSTSSFYSGFTFAFSNPTFSSPSYITMPGGAYFNSGTVYMEANLKARGGVGNDAAPALTLTGGTSGYTQINGSARSPIFYDSDNTGYYLDLNNTSIVNVIGFNGTSANAFGSGWAGGGGYPAYQFTGGNSRFGFSSTGGVVDVYADGNFYATDSSYLVPALGYNSGSGSGLYAAVFYDSNNTAYYIDPNSVSIVDTIRYPGGGGIQSQSVGTSYSLSVCMREAPGGSGQTSSVYAPRLGFHWGGVVASSIMIETSGRIAIMDNPGTGYEDFIADISYGSASSRAPIFYDSNNTAYYADPAGTSVFNALTVGGVAITGTSTNVAGLVANTFSPTGNTATTTLRNSYYGLLLGSSSTSLNLVGDASGNGGLYRELPFPAAARWPIYYNATTNCTGFNGTATTAGYAAQFNERILVLGTVETNYAIEMRSSAGGGYPAFLVNQYADVSIYRANNATAYIGFSADGLAYLYNDGTNFIFSGRGLQATSFGVGTAPSGTAGEIRATNNITAYYSSDIKFKTNVRDIPNALEVAESIGGKLFDWTDEYIEEHGGEDGYFIQKEDFGVIAQDVLKMFPVAVRTRPDGSLAVDYEKLSALAFAAVAELSTRVKSLEARI